MGDAVGWILAHAKEISEIVAYIIAISSIIIKWFIPTLKPGNPLIPYVKFVSIWLAQNRTVKDDEIRKLLQ